MSGKVRWDVSPGTARKVSLSLSGSEGQVSVKHGHDEGGIETNLSVEDAFVLGLDLVRAAGMAGGIANVKPIEVERV